MPAPDIVSDNVPVPSEMMPFNAVLPEPAIVSVEVAVSEMPLTTVSPVAAALLFVQVSLPMMLMGMGSLPLPSVTAPAVAAILIPSAPMESVSLVVLLLSNSVVPVLLK